MPEKLVRDKIPDIILATGAQPRIRFAGPGEYWALLRVKLLEEVTEFLVADKDAQELADILEVVYALAEVLGVSRWGLEDRRAAKEAERGAFRDRIVWLGNEGQETQR